MEFKAKSRYIEHTLTRDNILEDENYRKLLRTLKRLAERELPEKLRTELADISLRIARNAARGGGPEAVAAEHEAWRRRLPYLQSLYAGFFSRWGREGWAIFPALDGRVLSLRDVRKVAAGAGRMLFCDSSRNAVTDELQRHGQTVLAAGDWIAPLGRWVRVWTAQASRAYMAPRPLDDESLCAEMRELLETLRRADSASVRKYRSIAAADFRYPGSCIEEDFFVTQRSPGALGPARELPPSSLILRLLLPRRHCLLNAAHPAVVRLSRLHRTRPKLAAFLCLKMMHLHDGLLLPAKKNRKSNLPEKAESRLLEAALGGA